MGAAPSVREHALCLRHQHHHLTSSTSTCNLMACTADRYESAPLLEKYVYSFWWSVTTLVGKGLVFQPQTTIEQVCSTIT